MRLMVIAHLLLLAVPFFFLFQFGGELVLPRLPRPRWLRPVRLHSTCETSTGSKCSSRRRIRRRDRRSRFRIVPSVMAAARVDINLAMLALVCPLAARRTMRLSV